MTTFRFNVNNGRAQYACADPYTASLKPIPLGSTRPETYCTECQFKPNEPGCLFTPSYTRINPRLSSPPGPVQDCYRRAGRRRAAGLRAKGLTPQGKPLTEHCWNCAHLRQVKSASPKCYICQFDIAYSLDFHTVATMKQRKVSKTGCQLFELRLTDIAYLSVPSAVGTVPTTPPFCVSGDDSGQVVSTAEGMGPPP